MICANPGCGHSEEMHLRGGCIAIDRTHVPQMALRPPLCPCNAFVMPPSTSCEPLTTQLDAVIRTRQQ